MRKVLIEYYEPHAYVELDGTKVWADRYGNITKKLDKHGKDIIWLTIKGTQFLEPGYIFAPYIPLIVTNTVLVEDFEPRKNILSRYATRTIDSKFYGTVSFT